VNRSCKFGESPISGLYDIVLIKLLVYDHACAHGQSTNRMPLALFYSGGGGLKIQIRRCESERWTTKAWG